MGIQTVSQALSNENGGSSPFGFKNRIINGAMVIDQRNAGASVTPTNEQYTVDRWNAWRSQASKYSVQQNAGSVTPPVGFKNYLGVTSLSAYSLLTSDYFILAQKIEGYNFSDLAWGTANAQTVTLSFKVYSSLTGTFGGSIQNSAQNRSYPFSYTVSFANAWTNVSITIPGETSGTWLTTNGIGAYLWFGLGVGSTLSGTAGAWASAAYFSATGATSVVSNNGATFYITGVQLEKGLQATAFDYRDYGNELRLCQRYYWRFGSTSGGWRPLNYIDGTSIYRASWDHPVTMRASPTIATTGGFAYRYNGTQTNGSVSSTSLEAGMTSVSFSCPSAPNTFGTGILVSLTDSLWAVSAEL